MFAYCSRRDIEHRKRNENKLFFTFLEGPPGSAKDDMLAKLSKFGYVVRSVPFIPLTTVHYSIISHYQVLWITIKTTRFFAMGWILFECCSNSTARLHGRTLQFNDIL